METYSTLRPTNFVLKCFALNCIFQKDNQLKSSWSLSKNLLILLILCPINAAAFYFNILFTYLSGAGLSFSDVLHFEFVLGFLKYMVDLIYVRKYGTKMCLSYYNAYYNIDNILKMSYYNKLKAKCFKFMVLTCVSCIFAYVFEIIAWQMAMEYGPEDTSFVIEYFYTLMQMLTVLDMMSHLVQIEYRLRAFGDTVQKFDKTNKIILNWADQSNDFKVTRLDNLKILNLKIIETGTRISDGVLSLSQCYLMLIQQTEFLNKMFGFRVSI